MPDELSSSREIDRFLAACVRSCLRSGACPAFPEELAEHTRQVGLRVAFHGIALLLSEALSGLAQWPEGLKETIAAEARAQIFWEKTHRHEISALMGAFARLGIAPIVMKGTSLAYSVYGDPALRRRGDADILVRPEMLKDARSVLSDCGFRRVGSIQALQETWRKSAHDMFTHDVDLHWRIRSSATISQHLEKGGIGRRTIALPGLAAEARGLTPSDNLVLTSLNRASHLTFGYAFAESRIFEGDRLIWAVDIDLVASSLAERDWSALADSARRSGCAPQLHSALLFAEETLATPIPGKVLKDLELDGGSARLQEYLGTNSSFRRMMLELAAARGLREGCGILARHLLPAEERLRERFPRAAHWPLPLLHARRLAGAAGRAITGNS